MYLIKILWKVFTNYFQVAKGIPCQQKGYILRGKFRDASGLAKLSFELEVCRIPTLNVIGIRRKRLKGDAWCYKKVCEEVLRLAAVGKWTKSFRKLSL